MNRPTPVTLSEAQREIMEIIWDRDEVSAFEVREVLLTRRPIARETVRTLLTRMEEKGWVKHRVIGRTHFYSAAIPRDVNLGRRVTELVDTLCGGSAEQLVTALLDHHELSDAEADRIQKLIAASRDRKKQSRSQR